LYFLLYIEISQVHLGMWDVLKVEEFKGSKFNCLQRSKVQTLKSLKSFGIWDL